MDTKGKSVTVKGYAKINLHLDVVGRMDGGYHRMETVMQTVSLHDTVTVIPKDSTGFSVSCDQEGVPTDERNLAVRAALLFAERTGFSGGAQIRIEKRIPMAAGLAGGSADAAATLLALNRLHGEPLSLDELCALGARLGADVPFCIAGGTAYADGRGDVLHLFPEMPPCYLTVACGGEGVSTPWGYGLLDRLYQDFGEESSYTPRTTDGLKQALLARDLTAIAKNLYNIFEGPVLAERPVATAIRSKLLEMGAVGAMMSGSGPSVFGLFFTEEAAQRAAEAIQAMGYFATVCHPVFPGKDQ